MISVWVISDENFASSGGNKINETDFIDEFDEVNRDDQDPQPLENRRRKPNLANLIANRTESED